ncbi:MAG: NAD(P)H-hydrate epimerase [Planctomycetota bacterium]
MASPLTRSQSRAIDRFAIETLGYPGIVLMENAGRGCVDVMERLGIDGPVVIVTGKGNNAGDGFVIARHLALRGYEAKVALGAPPDKLTGDALIAFKMLTPCRVPILDLAGIHAGEMVNELDGLAGTDAAWVVDALLGTGAVGRPRPPLDALIDWINGEPTRTLAVDLPSGLDSDTGELYAPTVNADHTCTFVAPKTGFDAAGTPPVLGQVHTVSIGIGDSVIEAALRATAEP